MCALRTGAREIGKAREKTTREPKTCPASGRRHSARNTELPWRAVRQARPSAASSSIAHISPGGGGGLAAWLAAAGRRRNAAGLGGLLFPSWLVHDASRHAFARWRAVLLLSSCWLACRASLERLLALALSRPAGPKSAQLGKPFLPSSFPPGCRLAFPQRYGLR